MDSLFDTIAGLPIHPLVVHAVVIMLPLSAIGLLVCLLRSAWRERFGILVVLGGVAGAGAAWVAEQSGEQLAKRVGKPQEHAEWGERLMFVAIAYALVTLAWYAVARRPKSGAALERGLGILGGLLAATVITLTVIVGHSGASAVWAGKVSVTGGASAPLPSSPNTSPATGSSSTSSNTPTSSHSTTSPSAAALTMAVVAAHGAQSDCWAAIDGKVYNLTDWIAQHPGGPDKIIPLCGTDATTAFRTQHDSQREPTERLAQFLVGTLAAG